MARVAQPPTSAALIGQATCPNAFVKDRADLLLSVFDMATPRPGQGQGDEGGAGVATETKKKEQLKQPPLFKVLFHNDNYTTMEFVVWVLRSVFHKSESDSYAIMLNVHKNGFGVAGVFSKEIAETKIEKTHSLAKEHEFPLRLTMEPEEL